MWDFPNCWGEVDKMHVNIVPPPNCGSYSYNYIGSHSLVLMAVVNAKYEFLPSDIGVNGRISDGARTATCCAQKLAHCSSVCLHGR